MLDGVYRCDTEGEPVFVEVPAPTDESLQAVLHKIITRLMKLLTRRGVLVEEEGSTYMADSDADSDEARTLRPLHQLRRKHHELSMSAAKLYDMPETDAGPASAIFAEALAASGELAALQSELDVSLGWDVSVSVGAKRVLNTGEQSPYASVTLSRSFGLSASGEAAAEVARAAQIYAQEQWDGPWQQMARQKARVLEMLSTQEFVIKASDERVALLKQALQQARSSQSTHAKRTSRSVDVELQATEAERAAAQLRATQLAAWLEEESAPL